MTEEAPFCAAWAEGVICPQGTCASCDVRWEAKLAGCKCPLPPTYWKVAKNHWSDCPLWSSIVAPVDPVSVPEAAVQEPELEPVAEPVVVEPVVVEPEPVAEPVYSTGLASTEPHIPLSERLIMPAVPVKPVRVKKPPVKKARVHDNWVKTIGDSRYQVDFLRRGKNVAFAVKRVYSDAATQASSVALRHKVCTRYTNTMTDELLLLTEASRFSLKDWFVFQMTFSDSCEEVTFSGAYFRPARAPGASFFVKRKGSVLCFEQDLLTWIEKDWGKIRELSISGIENNIQLLAEKKEADKRDAFFKDLDAIVTAIENQALTVALIDVKASARRKELDEAVQLEVNALVKARLSPMLEMSEFDLLGVIARHRAPVVVGEPDYAFLESVRKRLKTTLGVE